jgi:GDP/UDP-N,N'-diacetylbacillosamine 2-epimerase (hydrolysing)
VQLGEDPKRVFNVGGMGIENIKRLKLLSKKKLEKSINFKLGKRNILVTFHPVTLKIKPQNINFKKF